jgi:hypothetical protein
MLKFYKGLFKKKTPQPQVLVSGPSPPIESIDLKMWSAPGWSDIVLDTEKQKKGTRKS